MTPETLLQDLLKRFDYATERPSADDPAIHVPTDKYVEICRLLRDEMHFDLMTDSTGVDWGQEASPRFSVLAQLFSTRDKLYVRVVTDCVGDENPEVPSLTGLFGIANWMERETYDMLGIKFTGHPDLRRILMWDSYPYFPLRKEFPLAGIETEFPAADVAQAAPGAKVIAAPQMGGPFHSPQSGEMSDREPRAADQSWTEQKEKPSES
ncbi:NADH-quinone oxidoreductase subunit C [Ruficoccus amylovorans]|uniref:NADH-quinone oxidoreductase subunit C n=1 Tax=Ruficoccus amylovorans TaxID=1804625 RepID=A0A842HI48_9BACT|nr:NADH-quinone oxidoreductase subunit C [Ruficoccus amylovorans]MBC2595840.1 NADH-quinone oxidoreductase subunit C [Ruficoccus amylovorans]